LQEHFTLLESTGGLKISFNAPTLPPLAAATEVAVYRITMEAITNVHRHSGATESQVSLRADRDVILEVLDNGCGLSARHHSGVGLSAMNERASELGGQCIIENRAGGGTRVFAMLPYRQES
jgi:signal transduction histidine kinase